MELIASIFAVRSKQKAKHVVYWSCWSLKLKKIWFGKMVLDDTATLTSVLNRTPKDF